MKRVPETGGASELHDDRDRLPPTRQRRKYPDRCRLLANPHLGGRNSMRVLTLSRLFSLCPAA